MHLLKRCLTRRQNIYWMVVVLEHYSIWDNHEEDSMDYIYLLLSLMQYVNWHWCICLKSWRLLQKGLTLKCENENLIFFSLHGYASTMKRVNNFLRTGNEIFCQLVYIVLYGYIIILFFCVPIISVLFMLLFLDVFR